MYNDVTKELILEVPQISDISVECLPELLTKLYAKIISTKVKLDKNKIECDDIKHLSLISLNLETLLLSNVEKEKQKSIAFVAAISNELMAKITCSECVDYASQMNIDYISTSVSSIILFLIANSQADAQEAANNLKINSKNFESYEQLILYCICELAKGNISKLVNLDFSHYFNRLDKDNAMLEEIAISALWKELLHGVVKIAKKLHGESVEENNHFKDVLELTKYQNIFGETNTIFYGLHHLAKLLLVLNECIYDYSVFKTHKPEHILPEIWNEFLVSMSKKRPYLWDNHLEILKSEILEIGVSTVLTLPTGSGKSTLSELKIASSLFSGNKIVYLVPTHALEEQISRSLSDTFKGLFIVSKDGQPNSDILVMTPEKCIMILNINSDLLRDVRLVVFDEFHLMHSDDDNNARAIDAMYCMLLLFQFVPNVDYLLISAMVSNGIQISEWIHYVTGRKCLTFGSPWKPTRQLQGCILYDSEQIAKLNKKIMEKKRLKKTKSPDAQLKKEMALTPQCLFSLKNRWETKNANDYYYTNILDNPINLGINKYWQLTPNKNELAKAFAINFSSLGVKALIFASDPGTVISIANKISSDNDKSNHNTDTDFKDQYKLLLDSLESELGDLEYSYFQAFNGVSVHHSLLLPIERFLIERYFENCSHGEVMVATATLAQGINIPAEVVIIIGDERYDQNTEHMEKIDPSELLNAAGRAGRAGHYAQGAVIIIPSKIITIQENLLSSEWWELKERVFSKDDQCLVVNDPIEQLINSINENKIKKVDIQSSFLFRLQSGKFSHDDTKKFMNTSLSAFKAKQAKKSIDYEDKINKFLSVLKVNSDINLPDWIITLSHNLGIDQKIILQLNISVSKDIYKLCSSTIYEIVDWLFDWLRINVRCLFLIFSKATIISSILKIIAINKKEKDDVLKILNKISIFRELTKKYISGSSLLELNNIISSNHDKPVKSEFLQESREFVLRLIPEISYCFGMLSQVILSNAEQNKILDDNLSNKIQNLPSIIKEGFDTYDKFIFKQNNPSFSRVKVHENFGKDNIH